VGYYYTQFDDLILPNLSAEQDQDIGTGAVSSSAFTLATGDVYDPQGSAQAQRARRNVPIQGTLVGSATEIFNQYNLLLARYGTLGQLWRHGVGPDDPAVDAVQQWSYVRLMDIRAAAGPNSRFMLPITLTFEQQSRVWYGRSHGAGWLFDSGIYFDTGRSFDEGDATFTLGSAPLGSSGNSITLTNNGHAYVINPVIQVVAGSSALTSITIENLTTGAESGWVWTGSVASTKTLQATASIKRITNDGTAAFAGWSRTGTNKVVDWLRLLPGSNTIRVSWTGGGTGSTITFVYADGYN
jgi:hypothetical protein